MPVTMPSMSIASLSEFLELLAAEGQLERIAPQVSPEFELAEIADRAVQAEGPALLFENVTGKPWVVAANVLGNQARLCKALDTDSIEAFADAIGQLAEVTAQKHWLTRLKTGAQEAPLDRFPPKTVRVGACQQVVCLGTDVDLACLPVACSWPEETVASVTAGLLVTSSHTTGEPNISKAPLAVLDAKRLAVVWDSYQPGLRDLTAYDTARGPMPVAVVLGGDPLLDILTELPLGQRADHLRLAGLLREQAVEMVACRTQTLEVPAAVEVVIEGTIDPSADRVSPGRLAGPNGYYLDPQDCPVLEVSAISHRSQPAFPVNLFRRPPTALNRLCERLLLAVAQTVAAEVVDLAIVGGTGSRSLVVVSIQKTLAGQVRRLAGALWGLPELGLNRTLMVVDETVDVRDREQVLGRLTSDVRFDRDLFFQDGPADPIAHAGSLRLGIDATAKLPGESSGDWPNKLAADESTHQAVDARWEELGLGSWGF